ncbi:hypothetical protein AVEN_213499-1 [Araneus ventricosus]|uniref:Uncharacterized protein n=1 Tax=Araneus ventricosus TaxID=182803 RepID=A0A4Y2WTS9_ARAVE|nr:hypothetical protein AVEN_213499-1 [Araneus ventricosus]
MDNSAIRVPSARAPSPMFGVEVANCDAFTVRIENVVKFQSRDGALIILFVFLYPPTITSIDKFALKVMLFKIELIIKGVVHEKSNDVHLSPKISDDDSSGSESSPVKSPHKRKAGKTINIHPPKNTKLKCQGKLWISNLIPSNRFATLSQENNNQSAPVETNAPINQDFTPKIRYVPPIFIDHDYKYLSSVPPSQEILISNPPKELMKL